MKSIRAAFLLLLPLSAVAGQNDVRPAYPPPGKLVDIGGYRLHLNCTGKNGPAVVLIAGAGDFSFDWGLVQPRAAAGPDLWAEELQAMYVARAKAPHQLGDKPLVVLLAKPESGGPPGDVSADEWKRVNEEKRRQKVELTNLSRNSRLIVAEQSGHHIQLDEPQLVTDAVRLAVAAARRRTRLAP